MSALDAPAIERAARSLAEARLTGRPLAGLSAACRPATPADAHAIQDATTAALGETVAGWKVGALVDGVRLRGAIYASRCFDSPARIRAAVMPMLGIEPEIAFRFDRSMPPRAAAYDAAEVAEAVTAFVAIEIVDSRFASYADTPLLDRAADCVSNGGFVIGTALPDWRRLDLAGAEVMVRFDGETIASGRGGHPAGDPLLPAIDLVNQLRAEGGVAAGRFMTTGTYAGVHRARAGQLVRVEFAGIGTAEALLLA